MALKLLVLAAATLLLSPAASAQYGNNDCYDAKERATSAASDLSDYARRLQRCAESGDISDDCSTEFRRLRNSHSDYESAVSDISSYCD